MVDNRMEYQKINSYYMRDERTKKFTEEAAKEEFKLINHWEIYEKIDGTNIRIIYTPPTEGCDEHIYFGGRTNDAQINVNLMDYLRRVFTVEKFRSNAIPFTCPVMICGEGIGPNIQGGQYGDEYGFVMFDVLIDKWWLDDDKKALIEAHFGVAVAPQIRLIHHGEDVGSTSYYKIQNIFAIKEFVQSKPHSLFSNREHTPMEGVVCRTAPLLFDKHGKMIVFKLKQRDFKG